MRMAGCQPGRARATITDVEIHRSAFGAARPRSCVVMPLPPLGALSRLLSARLRWMHLPFLVPRECALGRTPPYRNGTAPPDHMLPDNPSSGASVERESIALATQPMVDPSYRWYETDLRDTGSGSGAHLNGPGAHLIALGPTWRKFRHAHDNRGAGATQKTLCLLPNTGLPHAMRIAETHRFGF